MKNRKPKSFAVEDFSDNRLRTLFQRYLFAYHSKNSLLKGFRLCGAGTLPQKDVNVMATDESAWFSNVVHCRSPWACPHCSPMVMAKKGIDIAAAIDALASWYHQNACMLTFTIPHNKYMSCEFVFTLLKLTWRMFSKGGLRKHNAKKKYILKTDKDKDKRGVGKKGEEKIYSNGHNPYGAFRSDLSVVHNVRVYEFTWGDKNGWHPHIHALYWIPKDNFQDALKYEKELNDFWWHCLMHCAVKLYKQKFPQKSIEDIEREVYQSIFPSYLRPPECKHLSVYFSKNDDGTLCKISSARYVSGWGGDSELTGRQKRAQSGHYNPMQIILNAYKDVENRKKWLDLYTEYAIVTRGSRRVDFSKQNGLMDIIRKWKSQEKYIEVVKKKFMEREEGKRKVITFPSAVWKQILSEDIFGESFLRVELLYLARAPDAVHAARSIVKYLASKHIYMEFFEKEEISA